MSLLLKDVISAGYNPKDRNKITDKGYVFDTDLSNHNQQVYYNPQENKTLFNITGTHNAKDWTTNLATGLGLSKHTDRSKEAGNVLEKARKKYKDSNTTITSHSLGTQIGHNIAGNNDKHISLNGAYSIGQKARDNATNYRTKKDVVSVFSPSKNTKSLAGKSYNPFYQGVVENILDNHSSSSIENTPIYV